ncbi:MAG: IPT/TIG domain-containing protein [Deltaproteobacteria bacterium]|nr:IPT/TIG domain-containing protein [Deltaproteobacteria bacterium]
MATPSIDDLNPPSGSTGGRTLVEVTGSAFRLPPPPPAGGPTTALPPTVEVLVGGRRAEDVRVLAADRLTFLTPAHDAGPADVVVHNLADDGAPIPGEEATLPGGFTYVLPKLTAEADLTRLVRTLLRELKRQVNPNVSLTVQTDFDAETGDVLHLTELAALPGLVLVGPELSENRFSSINALPETPAAGGEVERRRVPYTVDLGFTIIGVADHTTELLNLMAATTLFFHRNKHIEMDRDLAAPAAGSIRYEMDFTPDGDLRVTSQPNESNVRSFSGSFVVRGFDLEGLAGVTGDDIVERTSRADEVVLRPPQQLTPTVPVGRNPDP